MIKATRGLYASAARTATPTAVEVNEASFDGVRITIDSTAVGVTPSTTFNVEAYEPTSDKWVLLLASAAISTVTTVVLTIGPGMPVTANVSANAVLTRRWRVRPVHPNAFTHTYSVGCEMYSSS